MKDLIKRIIKEGMLSKYRGIVPDMAGRITKGGLKGSNYVESGKLNLREELKKLVVKFIYINYGKEELENYKGKLTKFVYGLSDEDLTSYDSIFLKAVNNKDEESIVLANEFLDNVKSGNIDFQGIARRRQMNKKTYINRERQKVLPNKELEELKRQYVKARNGIKLGGEILNMKNKLKVTDVYPFYEINKYGKSYHNWYYIPISTPILNKAKSFGLIGGPYFDEVSKIVKNNVYYDRYEIEYKNIIDIFIDNVEEGLDTLKMKLDNLKELMYNKYGYMPKS